MQGSANLNIMIKAARKAGRSLVKDFREVENLQVSTKGAGDFVSRADIAAERILREELGSARPTYGWLGEETGSEDGKDPTRRWIVDPLDGTTNFLHGLPHWAVSIALEHRGKIVAGVVYDAAKDEMFYAEKGSGAWLNDSKRLRVSGRARMSEAIFATGVPFGAKKTLPATLHDLARLMPECAGVRRWGAAALGSGLRGGGALRRLLGTRAPDLGYRGGHPDRHRGRCAAGSDPRGPRGSGPWRTGGRQQPDIRPVRRHHPQPGLIVVFRALDPTGG